MSVATDYPPLLIAQHMAAVAVPRVHPVTGSPTGGAYPHADASDLPRGTWPAPADRCLALRALDDASRQMVNLLLDEWREMGLQPDWCTRLFRAAGIDRYDLDGRGAVDASGEPVRHVRRWSDGSEAMQMYRGIQAAPLPSAIVAVLWERCPREDRMWRASDQLGPLCHCTTSDYRPGGMPVANLASAQPRWASQHCDTCFSYGWVAYGRLASGGPIPLDDGTAARLESGQAGRLLAIIECECHCVELVRLRDHLIHATGWSDRGLGPRQALMAAAMADVRVNQCPCNGRRVCNLIERARVAQSRAPTALTEDAQ